MAFIYITDEALFPAHAGVIPTAEIADEYERTFPRTRGGDPPRPSVTAPEEYFSPHTRG